MFFLVIFGLILAGCKNKAEKTQFNNFKKVTGNPFTIGILSRESPRNILNTLYPLKVFLEKKLQRPIKIDISREFEEYYQKVRDKKIDILVLDPATYCEIRYKTRGYIIPLVKPEGGDGETKSVFVTKKSFSIEKIFDAIGKKLAIGDEKSSFSYLIPISMLRDVGLSLKDFKKVDIIKNEENIALSVLIGEYEVGALSEFTAKKYLEDGLKIIKESELTPRFLIAARADFPEKEKIKSLLLNQIDKEVLQSFNIKAFVSAEDRDFDYIRFLIRNFKGKDYIEYSKNTIKVAILPLYSPLTIYKRFEPLMRYLTEKTGYEFKLVVPRDFEEFIQIVSQGKVQFSYQNPYVYAIIAKRYPLKVLAITVGEDCIVNNLETICGDKLFRGVIIVRNDSKIKTLKDLKGKKVLIVSPYSAGGFLSQKIFLEKKGFNVYKDLKLINAKRLEKVIIGVYRGEADAGFVRESALSVFSGEIDISKIKILTFTSYLPNWPFCAVNVNSELAEKVKTLLLNINNKEILNKAKIKSFAKVSDKDYEFLKSLIK